MIWLLWRKLLVVEMSYGLMRVMCMSDVCLVDVVGIMDVIFVMSVVGVVDAMGIMDVVACTSVRSVIIVISVMRDKAYGCCVLYRYGERY